MPMARAASIWSWTFLLNVCCRPLRDSSQRQDSDGRGSRGGSGGAYTTLVRQPNSIPKSGRSWSAGTFSSACQMGWAESSSFNRYSGSWANAIAISSRNPRSKPSPPQ